MLKPNRSQKVTYKGDKMSIPLVDLKAQYQTIKGDIDPVVLDIMQRAAFVLGKEVRDLEKVFARYCQVTHAVGVDSGYSALELILRAYDIGPGDEVITTPNTFIATALAISTCGAKPVFVDIDPKTYNIDPSKLEEAITPSTRAILPVHLYGQPADMDPIIKIAFRHGLLVIEDACQAHGASYKGRKTGSLGHAAAFSFYPGKNLGAYGDGGMVVTNDEDIAEKIRVFRHVGQKGKNKHIVKGFNHRLDNLQAAVVLTKLPHLDGWNEARRRAAVQYNSLLQDLPVEVPDVMDSVEHIYHLYVIRTKRRDELDLYLNERGIDTGIHYPTPIHLQPAYQELGYRLGDFPITESIANEILSLPMYPELKEDQIKHIVAVIKEFFEQKLVLATRQEEVLGQRE
jgi:dTDP-4-amino-4,6-dideoxygalactose transaminase